MSLRGVRWRTAAIGIASTSLAMTIMSLWLGPRAVGTGSATDMTWFVDRAERARCAAEPPSWRIEGPAHSTVWAYDPATRRPANPAAPPLGDDLWNELQSSDMVVEWLGPGQGGTIAVRLAAAGPCAVVGARWPGVLPVVRVLGFWLGCGLLATIAGAILSSLGVVRPLTRRLGAVRRAATGVGAAAGYAPVELDADDDLGQLARELDRAHARIRADAGELERRRGELQSHIADVAHDIRTPLASLQLALEQAVGAGDPEAAREALMQAVHDVVYVGGLVGNLRLASELREGRPPAPAASAQLGETVERAALRVRFLARQKQVALEVAVPDVGVTVAGDPIAIEQAIANVIENAVTHNLAGGHVAVLLEEIGDDFQLTVADDGPGVEPGDLPRLGERTFRSDAARRRDGRGRGLGLAITTEVCERLGWRLAFAAEEPGSPATPGASGPPRSGLRVTIRGSRVKLETAVASGP